MYFLTGHIKLDKQNWAALHLGFLTGMKQNGYTDEELGEALKVAQDQIKNDLG